MAQIKKGTTNVTRYVVLLSDSDGSPVTGATPSNFSLQYTRAGAAPATATSGSALAATNSVHSDSGVIEVDATNSPGLYRIDWADAAFATGVSHVILVVTNSTDSAAPAIEEVELVDNVVGDVVDGNDRVDVGSWLGTAVTTSSTSGLPEVDAASISDDTTAADAVEANIANLDAAVTSRSSHDASDASTAVWGEATKEITGGTVDTVTNDVDINLSQAIGSPSADTVGKGLENAVDLIPSLQTPFLLETTATGASTVSAIRLDSVPWTDQDGDLDGALIIVFDDSDSDRPSFRLVSSYVATDNICNLSSDLDFTPANGDVVKLFAVSGSETESLVNNLAGGFGSSSPNRLIDHLRAMMSKTATAPTSGVGTYAPSTDSLERLGEIGVAVQGAGFDTGTDSLSEIRDAIDTLVAPAVVGSSALSGSGFLSDCVRMVRQAVDEPAANQKYTDSDIVELIQTAMDVVLTDIHVTTDHPIVVRHTIAVNTTDQTYVLPPSVAEVLRVAKINDNSNLPEGESVPGSYFNAGGVGWKLEGNTLRFLSSRHRAENLEIMYIPNGEALMHKGTAEAISASTLTLDASPTDGTLDTRPNAYVGSIVRILSSTQGIKEERLITGYNVATRVATLNKEWDDTPSGTVVYEVVPPFNRLIKSVVTLRAAIDLCSQEGNGEKMATLERNYLMKVAGMRRAIMKKEGRFQHHFDGDTWDNQNRGGLFGDWAL